MPFEIEKNQVPYTSTDSFTKREVSNLTDFLSKAKKTSIDKVSKGQVVYESTLHELLKEDHPDDHEDILVFNITDPDTGVDLISIYKKNGKLELDISSDERDPVRKFLEEVILRYEKNSKISNVINIKNQLTSSYLLLRQIMSSIKNLDEKIKVGINYRHLLKEFQKIEDSFI